jgi:hypothetical protein
MSLEMSLWEMACHMTFKGKSCVLQKLSCRMQNNIVVHACPMNFFYVFIVPGPILRHLGEFGKIRLILGEKYTFFAGGGSVWVSLRRAMTDFQFFFYVELDNI